MTGTTCLDNQPARHLEHITNIDVFERLPDLGFVGAGIQMAPNMARILDRLGVWEPIFKEATDVRETGIRGEILLSELLFLSR